jgi:tetratricopeptide (TPR) repeat protein
MPAVGARAGPETMRKAPIRKAIKTPSAGSSNAWMIHEKALKEFERGVGHLQRRNYTEALERFQAVLEGYPQEKELLDRAQVYMRICKEMGDRKAPQPKTTDEVFYFGVIKANDADYDEAVKLFERALQESPKDEKIHYLMASTLALKGDRREALSHLTQAIELNATNRIYARNDPDFEPLRDDETFQDLIHPEEM